MAVSDQFSPAVEVVPTVETVTSQEPDDTTSAIRRKYFDIRFMIAGSIAVLCYVIPVRWYQGWAAWEYGTDSTHPDFDKYWMTLLYAQLTAFVVIISIAVIGLWMTRDRNLKEISPEEELKRYMRLVGIAFVYAFMFVWAGSFFAEQDAAWHQVVVRDTSFTPSHIILFYGATPAYIIMGAITFMYATTRLPLFAKGISVPLVMVVIGPFLILPNVGFNEWGHAFWFMEEYFTAPLHWGFVFFGWSILALGGVLVQIISRMSVLVGLEFGAEKSGVDGAD